MRGGPSSLISGIEHPRIAESIKPRAVAGKWRLMEVAGQHDVWLVILNPFHQFGVTMGSQSSPTGR
jgi:hypothetical protein